MDSLVWVAWLVIGSLAGWLAHLVMGGAGLIIDVVVGIVGAMVAGFLFVVLGPSSADGSLVWSLFVAFIGAVVFLALLRLFSSETRYPVS